MKLLIINYYERPGFTGSSSVINEKGNIPSVKEILTEIGSKHLDLVKRFLICKSHTNKALDFFFF